MNDRTSRGIEAHAALLEVAERLGLPQDGLRVEALPKGASYASFLVRLDSESAWLIKIANRPAEIIRFVPAAAAVQAAIRARVPVPEILGVYESSDRWGPRPFLIQRFLEGEDAEDAWPRLDSAQKSALFFDLGTALARLHGIRGGAFTEGRVAPGEEADWRAHVSSRVGILSKANAKAGVLAAREIAAVSGGILRRAIESGDTITPSLAHRDLCLRNVLVRDGRFAAILDLEHSRYSDPLLDVASLMLSVFSSHPEALSGFDAGYGSSAGEARPLKPEMRQMRLEAAIALESFGAIAYWSRRKRPELVERAVGELKRCLRL